MAGESKIAAWRTIQTGDILAGLAVAIAGSHPTLQSESA